jgi:hypothetical protein
VTPALLLAMEHLLFSDDFFSTHKNTVAIVLDIPVLDQFIDPHTLSTFPLFNYESPKEYMSALLTEWTHRLFEEDKHRQIIRTVQEIIIPSLESLNSKDDQLL